MIKHKTNKTKGITLIALVVTIIVLLILAGISIQMLTGNNGGYSANADLSTKSDYIGITSSGDAYTNDLYFPHKAVKNNCRGYWLASPSEENKDYEVFVTAGGSVYRESYNRFVNNYCGVRPVVCLPSGIGLKTNSSNSNLYDITNGQWDN